jgi:hypothetical protein
MTMCLKSLRVIAVSVSSTPSFKCFSAQLACNSPPSYKALSGMMYVHSGMSLKLIFPGREVARDSN